MYIILQTAIIIPFNVNVMPRVVEPALAETVTATTTDSVILALSMDHQV